MTRTTTRPNAADHVLRDSTIDLPAHEAAHRPVCPEELARVTATAADLVVQGRRVTPRSLASLTGLEPAVVQAAVDQLVSTGLLRAAGSSPHHYVFAPGRWPVPLARS